MRQMSLRSSVIFFYLIVQVVKKDLRWPWLLFTSKKEKARIKKPLIFMCASFNV